jgi:hypothetical protein
VLGGTGARVTAPAPLGHDSRPSADNRQQLVESYARIPLRFEANAGQTDSRVKFLSRGAGYTLFLTGDETVLALKRSGVRSQKQEHRNSKFQIGNAKRENATGIPRAPIPNLEPPIRGSETPTPNPESRASAVLRVRLLGANPAAKVTGAEELPGKANYFIGNDPKKWHTSVPTYAKVNYKDVYPGVDLLYYGNQSGQLEYDFVVAPGADPGAIALDVGAGVAPVPQTRGRPQGSPLQIAADGDLVIATEGGELRFHKPVAYQGHESRVRSQESGAKEAERGAANNRKSPITNHKSVEARFVLDPHNRVHFALGPYDHTQPLVIDPVLIYSTYLGGSNFDEANGIAVDSSGNAYVTGYTYSSDFPTAYPLQASLAGTQNAFVAKLRWVDRTSTVSLVYSTYLGGSSHDYGNGIAVDSSGNAYVTGCTQSSDFPTAHPLQASLAGTVNAFVARLNPRGSALIYSTYLGGSAWDGGYGIAVDSSGNAYMTGVTSSGDFPTAYPLQASLAGNENAFVAKLNWDASTSTLSLVYSTYLGGSGVDGGAGIAVDSSGNAYVTGGTSSSNFPTAHPVQASFGGSDSDAFVAKLNWDASTSTLSLVYSTYLGGGSPDGGAGIAADSSGNAYVAGYTYSSNFPTANPLQGSLAGYGNAFVAKLNWAAPTSTLSLVYSTYLGVFWDLATGIAVDSSGNAYVTGVTSSSGFPTANPLQASFGGGSSNAFVAQLSWAASTSTLSLVYSTYLGGSGTDCGLGIAVDSSGNAYVVGSAWSSDFPTAHPLQASFAGGSGDAFVAKIGPADSPGIAFGPGALTFAAQIVGTSSPLQSVTVTAAGSQALNLSSISISGDFALASTATSCPYSGGTVPSGTTCTIDVTFTPWAAGTRTGSVSVNDNASGSPQTVPLTGTGIAVPAGATLSPTSLSFGNQSLNTTSGTKKVTLSSTGTVNLAIASITFTGTNPGDFAQTNNCPSTMAPGASCTISVTFTPSVLGAESATLNVNDDAANSPQTVALSGTGLAPATLTPASASFGDVAIHTASKPKAFTLKNNQSVMLNNISITLSNPDFAKSSTTCGGSLAAHGSCTITVTFTPSVLRAERATLTVSDSAPAPYNKLTSSLSGTGVAQATVSPTSLTFSKQRVGTTSAAKNVTLKNNLLTTLAISSLTFTGADPSDFAQTDTCDGSVAAQSTCTISVTFKPSATGTRTATLNVKDSANNSPQVVSLTGTGR